MILPAQAATCPDLELRTLGAPQPQRLARETLATRRAHSKAARRCSNTVSSRALPRHASSATQSRLPCDLTTRSKMASARLSASTELPLKEASSELHHRPTDLKKHLSHQFLFLFCVPIPTTMTNGKFGEFSFSSFLSALHRIFSSERSKQRMAPPTSQLFPSMSETKTNGTSATKDGFARAWEVHVARSTVEREGVTFPDACTI